jgi:hypothetical protein
MTDENKGVKYPRQLAINETSSRRQIDQLELFENEAEPPLVSELKKSLYTLSVSHAVIFDGLCLACTALYDKKWQDAKTGKWHDIIGRKDDITETHYRLFSLESFIKYIFVGNFENEWPNVRNQLMKLVLNPEPKKLIIDEKHFIIDAPIKVTPWYETDNIERFIKLSPRRKGNGKGETGKAAREATGERETGKVKGRIIGWSIEFFKPLFESLLLINANRRKTAGKNYLLTPPYFQLKLNAMCDSFLASTDKLIHRKPYQIEAMEEEKVSLFPQEETAIRYEAQLYKLKLKQYYTGLKDKMGSITPLQLRKFYMKLGLKDNRRGDYITIDNLVGFVYGVWPELIETDRNGNKVLYPARYRQVLEKINIMLNVHFRMLVDNQGMNGGQLVPLAILEGKEFTRETNKLRIQCVKQNTMYSQYKIEDVAKYLADMPPMLGK